MCVCVCARRVVKGELFIPSSSWLRKTVAHDRGGGDGEGDGHSSPWLFDGILPPLPVTEGVRCNP